jgi:hypothetical protein
VASRALRRSAAAMLRPPRARRMPMARLRRLAMARGAVPVRTWATSAWARTARLCGPSPPPAGAPTHSPDQHRPDKPVLCRDPGPPRARSWPRGPVPARERPRTPARGGWPGRRGAGVGLGRRLRLPGRAVFTAHVKAGQLSQHGGVDPVHRLGSSNDARPSTWRPGPASPVRAPRMPPLGGPIGVGHRWTTGLCSSDSSPCEAEFGPRGGRRATPAGPRRTR